METDLQNPTNTYVSDGSIEDSTIPAAIFDPAGEIELLKKEVAQTSTPQELKEKIDKMLLRLSRMVQIGGFQREFEPIEQYVKWVVQMPWGIYTQDNLDLLNVQTEMNKTHYGLQVIKDMIIEYLAVMKLQREGPPEVTQPSSLNGQQTLNSATSFVSSPSSPVSLQGTNQANTVSIQPQINATNAKTEMVRLQGSSSHAPVLCFVGIQGVGKTSVAKSIAASLGRKFVRISLGALGSASQIRGIARSESNAEPGQIIKGIIRSGTMNPLILLDEIDKTSSESGLRADLMAALLEILDPEQNSTFVDHYLDYPVDLSQVIFITTANNLGGISAALQDRLEIIRFGSYTDNDKMQIAQNYMLPKVLASTGLTTGQITFDPVVWALVVRPLGFDAGVRQLERTLTILARKVARMIIEGKVTSVHITKDNFRQFIPEEIGVYS